MEGNSRRLRAIAAAAVIASTLFAVAGFSSSATAHSSKDPLTVSTSSGTVRGIEKATTRQWLGVPYAAAPTGSLRFAPPTPFKWKGTYVADTLPAPCPQLGGLDTAYSQDALDENCLRLDIYQPTTVKAKKLPVHVIIHGGGYQGGGSQLVQGTDFAAASGAIVVSIQYRLGALGFINLPELDGKGGGNFGILDMVAALKWVEKNIDKFGGDPKNVTIGGQSAGGSGVATLVASPLAKGLFDGAIMQSPYFPGRAEATSQTQGASYATRVGCADAATRLDCLRALPVSAYLAAGPGSTGPVVDGEVLTAAPLDVYASGKFNKVPVIIGANVNDLGGFNCGALRGANRLAPFVPTYLYAFSDPAAPPIPGRPIGAYGNAPGPQHSAELAYIYNVYGYTAAFSPAQVDLSNEFKTRWSQFVATKNPNSSGLATWSRVTTQSVTSVDFTPPKATVQQGYPLGAGCTP